MDHGIATASKVLVPYGIARPQRGVSGLGLLDTLVAFWPGDEPASGDRLDWMGNDLHMADTNNVGTAAGLQYATSRQYVRATPQWHTVADNPTLSMGDTDYTVAAWVYLDNKANYAPIVTRYHGASTAGEFYFLYWQGTDRYRILLYDGDISHGVIGDVSANSYGSPATGVWTLVIWWHDATANKVYIQVNDGTVDEAATSGTPGDANVATVIGTRGDTGFYMDGRIGPVAVWKSTPGGGGVLNAAQRTALYNTGSGLTLEEMGYTYGDWWDPFGDSLAVWGAWRATGASSYADSKVDQSSAGHDLTEGVAPTWDATNGWTSDGTKYLETGFVPGGDTLHTMAIWFTNSPNSSKALAGVWETSLENLEIRASNGGNKVMYINEGWIAVTPYLASGWLAITGWKGWRNGIRDGGNIPGYGGTAYTHDVWVLTQNRNGAPYQGFVGKIRAITIIDEYLSPQQMLAIYMRMKALFG